jgi:hypothetical protein
MARRNDDAGTVLDWQHLDRIDPGASVVNCKTMQKSHLFCASSLGATPSSFLISHNEQSRSGPCGMAHCPGSSWIGVSYFSDGPDRRR